MTPEELFQLIETQPDIDHATWKFARIADAMNAAKVETRTNTRLTTTTLLDQLEPDEYGALRTAIDQLAEANPFAAGVREALAGAGVAIGDDRAIGFVDQFVRPVLQQLGAEAVADKVIAMGLRVEPLLAEPVTAADCEAACNWSENSKWLADRYNAAFEVLENGATREAIKAALTAE